MQKKLLDYQDDDVLLEGYYACSDDQQKKPVVFVVHDWSGRNQFAEKKAEQLAELGYLGFAIDMYGKGKKGHTKEEKLALMQPLMQDRNKLQKRILSALNAVKHIPEADQTRLAAIGFCFGGLCVLDLARSGAQIEGVVSLHGLLQAPEFNNEAQIKAKILVLHGYDDPMVKPNDVNAFAAEMTNAHADWQVHIYGNTMHAFTNPEANDPNFGTVYNKLSDERSWRETKNFLQEMFA